VLACNEMTEGKQLANITAVNMQSCVNACVEWNMAGQKTEVCVRVNVEKGPGGRCFLRGKGEGGVVEGRRGDSAVRLMVREGGGPGEGKNKKELRGVGKRGVYEDGGDV
jgi:hypothetical protein